MRVVLDTNVIVSAYITASPTRPPRAILQRWHAGEFQFVVCDEVLWEYERVLTRPWCEQRHGLSARRINRDFKAIRHVAEVVRIDETERDPMLCDPEDAIFLACAIVGHVDFIVSGDRHLLELRSVRGIPIIPPIAFVSVLDAVTS
jgi:putative PIN family toxin of toxin-antitoxin system